MKFKLPSMVILVLSILLVGCSEESGVNKTESSCSIYLENLPKEYEDLTETIKENIEISVSLRSISSDEKHKIVLSDENEYNVLLPLKPGNYEVYGIYMSNTSLAMFDIDTEVETVTISNGNEFDLPVFMTNPSQFISAIENNSPKKEIIDTDMFSRKVQYNGEIIDLNTIKKVMQFATKDNESLAPTEEFYIPSTSHAGVSMVVQNQKSGSIPINEATFVGVRFYNNNVVFPKGIIMGMDISSLAHAEDGVLGTPDYFVGTPLIGMGIEHTTLVYLDEDTGDRISFEVKPSDSYISSIKYEFEKYE